MHHGRWNHFWRKKWCIFVLSWIFIGVAELSLETVWRAGHTYNTLFNWECANWYAPFDVPGMHYHFRTNRHGSSECISIPHGLHGPANHRYSSAFSQKVRLWQGSGHAVVLCFHFFLIWFCSMLNVFKYIMIHSSLLFMQDRFVEMPTLWFHRYDFDSDTIWNGDGIQYTDMRVTSTSISILPRS